MKKGDYVFIQFGHNDEKADSTRHTEPGTTFDDNLRRYVNETRAKGGIPVLFNSIVRRNFVQPQDASIAKDVRRTPGKRNNPKKEQSCSTLMELIWILRAMWQRSLESYLLI